MAGISSIGSEGVIVLTMYILVKDVIVPLIRRRKPDFLNTQKTKLHNPESIPGKAESCIKHGNLMTKLSEAMKNLKEQFDELRKQNRQDHHKLFDKIEKKKNRGSDN